MDGIKKLFPHALKANDASSLVVAILLYLLGAVVGALVIWLAGLLTGWIPVVGTLVGIVCRIAGALVDLYALAGIIIAILVFCKVLK